jgi:5'-methylthioadenosine phosphorylase
MSEAEIGVIGGSGLYHIEGMSEIEEIRIHTPFGEPSDAIHVGKLEGVRIAFLPRHARGHRISPTELPVRANIYALKSLGIERIISVNAAGSLNVRIKPLDLVIPDQIIDRTRNRISTFFSGGIVGHVAFADPYCPVTSKALLEAALKVGVNVHRGGVYLIMEGPQFSTRAESNLYRSWGADLIGMTGLPEAKLAREAEICYSSLSFVTDYDCWNDSAEPVTTEMILLNLMKNVDTAKRIIKLAIGSFPQTRDCPCASALQDALVTAQDLIPEQVKKDLGPLIGKYIK